MNVLVVVEDDPGMLVLIEEVLGEVPRLELSEEVSDLDAALEAARKTQPDLVILDHFILGDVMGLEAAPMLKEVVPAAKIIMLTSHDLSVEVSREPAIDELVLKKDLDQLLGVAQRLLGLEP